MKHLREIKEKIKKERLEIKINELHSETDSLDSHTVQENRLNSLNTSMEYQNTQTDDLDRHIVYVDFQAEIWSGQQNRLSTKVNP